MRAKLSAGREANDDVRDGEGATAVEGHDGGCEVDQPLWWRREEDGIGRVRYEQLAGDKEMTGKAWWGKLTERERMSLFEAFADDYCNRGFGEAAGGYSECR